MTSYTKRKKEKMPYTFLYLMMNKHMNNNTTQSTSYSKMLLQNSRLSSELWGAEGKTRSSEKKRKSVLVSKKGEKKKYIEKRCKSFWNEKGSKFADKECKSFLKKIETNLLLKSVNRLEKRKKNKNKIKKMLTEFKS